MGNLRSVGGWGEVDLDQRAITTEDDIVDLSELDRSDDQPNQPAPATQNGAAEHDEPSEGQPPAAASRRTAPQPKPHPQATRPAGRAMRTSTAGSRTALPDWAAPSPRPSRARLRSPVTPESRRQAMLPRPRPALPAFRARNPRCRRSPAPAAGYAAAARYRDRSAGLHVQPRRSVRSRSALAGPRSRSTQRQLARHMRGLRSQRRTRALTAGPSNRASGALSATIAAVDLRAPRARASSTPRAQHVAPAPQAPAPPPEPQGRYLKPPSSRHRQRAKHRVRPNVAPTANVQLHAGTRHVQQHQPSHRRLTNPSDQQEPARLWAKRDARPRPGRPRHPVRRHPSSAQDPHLHPPQRHRAGCPVRRARRHVLRGAQPARRERRHPTAQEPMRSRRQARTAQ